MAAVPRGVLYGAAAGLVGIVLMSNDATAPALRDLLAGLTGRGRRVGPRTKLDSDGIVQVSPGTLAAEAGLGIDVYSLARMLSSEAGPYGATAKLALAWATMNASGGRAGIFAKVTASRGAAAGKFSRQNVTGGKWCATGVDPYQDDVRIAQAVIARAVPDPTGGATNWFSPRAQDALAARGEKGYRKTAAQVAAEWRAGGLEPVTIAGVDRSVITFWRPAA